MVPDTTTTKELDFHKTRKMEPRTFSLKEKTIQLYSGMIQH